MIQIRANYGYVAFLFIDSRPIDGRYYISSFFRLLNNVENNNFPENVTFFVGVVEEWVGLRY